METLIAWDIYLFRVGNQFAHNAFMDGLMALITNKWTWIPLYVFMTWKTYTIYKKKILWVLIMVAVLVASSDLISTRAIKRTFKRERPCSKKVNLGFKVNTLPGHGCSDYSFVSSHASNSFGIALFIGLLFYKQNKWWLYGGLLWATVVSYSRIYVGKHYPLDLLGGALLGTALAYLWYYLLKIKLEKE